VLVRIIVLQILSEILNFLEVLEIFRFVLYFFSFVGKAKDITWKLVKVYSTGPTYTSRNIMIIGNLGSVLSIVQCFGSGSSWMEVLRGWELTIKDPGFSSMYVKHLKHNFFVIVDTKRLKRALVIGQHPPPADKKIIHKK
jgi:hypothetical protein